MGAEIHDLWLCWIVEIKSWKHRIEKAAVAKCLPLCIHQVTHT